MCATLRATVNQHSLHVSGPQHAWLDYVSNETHSLMSCTIMSAHSHTVYVVAWRILLCSIPLQQHAHTEASAYASTKFAHCLLLSLLLLLWCCCLYLECTSGCSFPCQQGQ